MRRAAVAIVAALALPAPAASAPFGELPFRPVSGAPVCLAPTGTPGGLVRWTPQGAELLEATAAGLVPQATFALGRVETCPAAAVDASGAGVVAGATSKGLRVAIREPGGGWAAPVTLPSKLAAGVSAAVSARGDVVVAWIEYDAGFDQAHVEVARRAPGAAFGTPQRLAADSTIASAEVAVTATGEALLMVADDRAVRTAIAPAGSAFAAPARLLQRDVFAGEPALAVTPGGRALLAAPGENGTTLFDREPGGAFVRRPAISLGDSDVALALRDDGTAIVAWESLGTVTALRREGTGPFGPRIDVQGEQPRRPTDVVSFGLSGRDGPPVEQPRLRVAIGADGRGLLAWPGVETGLQAASLAADGSREVLTLGSPVRPASGMTPLLLADGTRAVAWTDANEAESVPPYGGRTHLAVEGAADASAAAVPEVTVGAPRDRTLRPIQPLRLPIRCSAACDVRAFVVGWPGAVSLTRSRAGTSTLEFLPGPGPVAPKRGPRRITLSWSAPGARTASSRTIALKLRRLPAPPLPHLLDVRARRASGGVVDVRWRTDGPARDASFIVVGTRGPRLEANRTPVVGVARGGTRRRSFHIRLRDARAVRYVTVSVSQPLGRDRRVRVRVQ